MATINFNGMELEEFTTPQIFDPPKAMVVWEDGENPIIALVIAILAESSNFQYRVLTNDWSSYPHCALLPDPPKPRRATNRELARWLAQGNGLMKSGTITSGNYTYATGDDDHDASLLVKVRKWSDTEWHEPTVEYLFGGDK